MAMKLQIKFMELLQLLLGSRLHHFREDLTKLNYLLSGAIFDSQFSGKCFKNAAQVVRFVDDAVIEVCNERSPVRDVCDKPFFLERAQCFTQRASAHSEMSSQSRLINGGAWGKFSPQDSFPYRFPDCLTKSALLEMVECAHSRASSNS